ncbi:MAG: hypothetical protein AB1591_10205 [Pseudomonadota bacterium]
MKNLLLAALCLTLSACGGGPAVPDWKQDSVSLIQRYQKAELKGRNILAERYFEQALAAAGSAARLEETARLHLIRCATRQASLTFETCGGYLEHARFGATPEDAAYHAFISGQWDKLDPARLPGQYRAFAANRDPARNVALLQAIDDPLSRLIASSVAILRAQADESTLRLAADTASEQGWAKPLLVYLKLLESRAAEKQDTAEREKLRTRIKLVEDSL